MKQKFNQLKKFNWKLFFALSSLALIPAIYQTIKTLIISSNNQPEVFDVIGQMEWFDLINETIQAFLVIPLYSILNKILNKDKENFSKWVFKTGVITLVLYSVFSVVVLVYGEVLIKAMNNTDINLSVVSSYLKLETLAFMIGIVVSFINVVFVVVGSSKNVYIFLCVNIVLSLITDLFMIPNFGVYGIALSNICVNLILSVVSVILLHKQKNIQLSKFTKNDIIVIKSWAKVGVFSGCQQLIDNLIYAVMICKMVNLVSEQGNYWLSNNFIWGWLLIPVSALTEVIRRDCKDGYSTLHKFNYYFIGLCTVLVWTITIPLWPIFYKYAENLSNANEIFVITLKLVPFYIAYAASAIIDNIFVGLGKTWYNMINSIIINFVYYGVFYILYLTNAITFTLDTIILMFGLGMVCHLIVSIVQEKIFKRNLSLQRQVQ